jgi:hypothetical protein
MGGRGGSSSSIIRGMVGGGWGPGGGGPGRGGSAAYQERSRSAMLMRPRSREPSPPYAPELLHPLSRTQPPPLGCSRGAAGGSSFTDRERQREREREHREREARGRSRDRDLNPSSSSQGGSSRSRGSAFYGGGSHSNHYHPARMHSPSRSSEAGHTVEAGELLPISAMPSERKGSSLKANYSPPPPATSSRAGSVWDSKPFPSSKDLHTSHREAPSSHSHDIPPPPPHKPSLPHARASSIPSQNGPLPPSLLADPTSTLPLPPHMLGIGGKRDPPQPTRRPHSPSSPPPSHTRLPSRSHPASSNANHTHKTIAPAPMSPRRSQSARQPQPQLSHHSHHPQQQQHQHRGFSAGASTQLPLPPPPPSRPARLPSPTKEHPCLSPMVCDIRSLADAKDTGAAPTSAAAAAAATASAVGGVKQPPPPQRLWGRSRSGGGGGPAAVPEKLLSSRDTVPSLPGPPALPCNPSREQQSASYPSPQHTSVQSSPLVLPGDGLPQHPKHDTAHLSVQQTDKGHHPQRVSTGFSGALERPPPAASSKLGGASPSSSIVLPTDSHHHQQPPGLLSPFSHSHGASAGVGNVWETPNILLPSSLYTPQSLTQQQAPPPTQQPNRRFGFGISRRGSSFAKMGDQGGGRRG